MSAEKGIFIPISDLKQIIKKSSDLLQEQKDALVAQLKESTSTPESQLTEIEKMLGFRVDEEDLQERIDAVQSEVKDITEAVDELEEQLGTNNDSRSKFLSSRLVDMVDTVRELKKGLENYESIERGLPAVVQAVMIATTDSLVVVPLTPKQKLKLDFELNRLGFDFDSGNL